MTFAHRGLRLVNAAMRSTQLAMSLPLRARAFWTVGAGHGELREEELPRVGDQEVLVAARYSAVSRGTESLVFHGRVPPSEWQRMRAPHQRGAWPSAVKYGYARVGEVLVGVPQLMGRRVFVLYPHQDFYVVPARDVAIIPDGVPDERAVLAANMETALNAVWDAPVLHGERIVVVGAGVVGSLIAYLAARTPGTEVTLVDVQPVRERLAAKLGARFALPDAAPRDVDLVVHASGNPAGLVLSLDLAGDETTVLDLSWYGDTPVTLPLGQAFHSRRLCLRASQVGHVAPRMRARFELHRRLALALSLLRDPVLDAPVSGESRFEQLPEVMAAVCASAAGALCHRIRYGASECTA